MNYLIKNISLTILLTLLITMASPADVLAQLTDTTGLGSGMRGAPHIYKFDTRTTALGDATVSDPTNLSSININPAALSFIHNFEAMEFNTFQNWNNNLLFANVTLPVFSFRNNRLAAQFAAFNSGLDAANPLGDSPQPEPDISMYQADFAYSFSMENTFSFGVFNSTTLSKNEDAQFWTNFTTLGMLYAPTATLSYGITFRGLGRSVVYNISPEGNTTLESQDLREILELGATIKFPVEAEETDIALSLANEKRFGQPGIWYKIGFEFIAASAVALRTGFILQPEQELFSPRLGFGLISDVIEFNYALSFQDRMYERFHQVGVTINLD
ncbi:MAG: hypothetical protein WD016_07455 [Balneolaceae bacterium]